MKLLFAFFTLSSLLLLLFAGSIDGRKELEEYWKNVMKEQPMPEVIQNLVSANHQEDNNPNAKNFFVDDLSQPYGVFAWVKNKPKEGRNFFVDDLSQPYGVFAWIKNKPKEGRNFVIDDLSVFAWIKNKRKEGRKEVGESWKKTMKEEPMPAEVIQDLVHKHAEAELNNANAKEEKPGFSNGESSHCDNEESSSPSEPKFGIKDNPIEKVTAN